MGKPMKCDINKIKTIYPRIFHITCSCCGRQVKRETMYKYSEQHYDTDLLDDMCYALGMFNIYGCRECFHSKKEFYNRISR